MASICTDITNLACSCTDVGDPDSCTLDTACSAHPSYTEPDCLEPKPTCSDSSNPACNCAVDPLTSIETCLYHTSCLDDSDLACVCIDLTDSTSCSVDATCSGDLSTCSPIPLTCQNGDSDACLCEVDAQTGEETCTIAASCLNLEDTVCVCESLSDVSTCEIDSSCDPADLASCALVSPTCTDPLNEACSCTDPLDSATCSYSAACFD